MAAPSHRPDLALAVRLAAYGGLRAGELWAGTRRPAWSACAYVARSEVGETKKARRNLAGRAPLRSEEPKVASVLVGEAGFEPAASCSQSRRAAKLRHSPELRHSPGAVPLPRGCARPPESRCRRGLGGRARFAAGRRCRRPAGIVNAGEGWAAGLVSPASTGSGGLSD